MREIKFRVWDKQNKLMANACVIEWSKGRRGNGVDKRIVYVRGYQPGGYEVQSTAPDYTDRFELMQFTGMRDGGGKEIYEGDIRRAEYYAGGEKCAHIAVMEWDENFSGFMWATAKGTYYQWMRTEVIGNIYEHPELLGEGRVK